VIYLSDKMKMKHEKAKVRAQYASKGGYWRIVIQTNNGSGGWAVFSSGTTNQFATREEAEVAVEELCMMYKGSYELG